MRQNPEVPDRLPRIEVPIGPEPIHGVRVILINIDGRTIELAVITMFLVLSSGEEFIKGHIRFANAFEKFMSEEGKGVARELPMIPETAGLGCDQGDSDEGRKDQSDNRKA